MDERREEYFGTISIKMAEEQNGRGEGKRRTWEYNDEQKDEQGAQTNTTWYMQKRQ
jgi:hypothetical protein